MLGNIKQPPLTPKLSTAYAGVDLTLPTMTSHGVYTYHSTEHNQHEEEWDIRHNVPIRPGVTRFVYLMQGCEGKIPNVIYMVFYT